MILGVGSNDGNTGGEVTRFGQWFNRYAASYAPPVDGYYGYAERDAVRILQDRLRKSGKAVSVTGEFDLATQAAVGYKVKGATTPPVVVHRPIWMYSAPGSGAPGNVGPSFQLGERCRNVLHINHQWLGYPIGGYLGFMGGDPKFSYNEVIGFLDVDLERQIAACPDLNDPNLEFWFSAYSQSADGMLLSILRLFGDGGRFAHLRNRINGIIMFGNPATPGTGIARRTFPAWLNALTRNINYANDFYAVAPDAIRPAMYGIIVQAEMELPFFVHVLRIAVPVIQKWAATVLPMVAPLLAGFGPLMQMGLGLISGLQGLGSNPLLGSMIGQAGSSKDTKVDEELIALLEPMGLLSHAGDLIGLVGALPGLQAHGGYELDPVMMDRAYDVVAGFRR